MRLFLAYFLLFLTILAQDGDSIINISALKKQFLKEHNTFRKRCGGVALKSSKSLDTSAQKYSAHLLQIMKMQHSHNNAYGENLGYSSPSRIKEIPGVMFNEYKLYDFGNPGFDEKAGHFTQLVWKASRKLGTGISCDKNYCFVVFHYQPPGNIMSASYFKKNVQKPT